MLKGSDERLNTLTAFPVVMNGSRVKQVATTKSLGVTINVKLGWNCRGKGYSGFQVTGMIEWGQKNQPPPPQKKKKCLGMFVSSSYWLTLSYAGTTTNLQIVLSAVHSLPESYLIPLSDKDSTLRVIDYGSDWVFVLNLPVYLDKF